MERLKHSNDIEIKLLANRRFIYANRKSNIVITAEHRATEITVLFPEEYEDYSKRVDFVNSQGKEWTEGLYTPEYKKYKGGFSKTRFHFTLPTEVTTEGELKMQFLAYLPDESMTTVPFEVIPIDVQNGMLAFKRNSKSNPDLLILSANQSAQALFNSQKAIAKSEQALANSGAAVATADDTAARLSDEIDRAMQAEADITAALEAEVQARVAGDTENTEAITAEAIRAQEAENTLTEALAVETLRATAAEESNAAAIEEENQRATEAEVALSERITAEVDRATQAEQNITADLAAETQRSTNADEENAQAIAEETIRAVGAESAIAAGLAAEIQRATTFEQINADAITTENIRAEGAEADLQSQIIAEQARAMLAESNLQNGLINESSRSIQAEAELRAGLNTEISRATTQEQINATAIVTEEIRAMQAETVLGVRVDTEVSAAIQEAKQYADQVAEQVRIDGTIYKGTVDESDLPLTGNENGDLYWISDFDLTEPNHSGSAIFNGKTNKWDFNIDRYKHQDNETIVARDSDGALKVADTNEINLTPDTTDFGGTVQLGFKAMMRSLIRKIRGLFQKSAENTTAISTETSRATTAESALSSSIAAEVTRATAAEQINTNAIQAEVSRATSAENSLSERITAEVSRATTAESGLSSRITAEETRAKSAEQTNAASIAAETTRAMTAESGLATSVMAEEARAKAAEQANVTAIAAEETRARTAEQALAQSILDVASGAQSDWNQTDDTSLSYIHNKPTSLPASDVYPWAKAATKPTYTASEVGLGNVNNTSDANKPVSTATQTALNNKVDKVTGKQLSTEDYSSAEKTKLAGIAAGAQVNTVTSVAGKTGAVTLAKSDVGLGNVDNTSDANKPVSTATQTALNNKVDKVTGKQLSTEDYTSAEKTKLAGIAAGAQVNTVTSVAGKTGAVNLAKSDVGLGNVDNTSDANKPISTATQTALNNKVDKVSGKDLSTNDYTTAEKNKLAGIEAGAQVNTVTGIKGNSETSYRTGGVNLTPANIGAEPAFTKNGAFNKNFGTASGTVCEGNDSRLSNSRTPTSHASTATTYGQGDPSNYGHVKLSSLDGGTETASGDCARRYNYTSVSGVTGLDLNNYRYEGSFTLYSIPSDALNFPSGWGSGSSNTAYLEVRRFYSSTAVHQTLYKRGTTQRWVRYSTASTSWTDWVEVDVGNVKNTQRNLGGSSETAGYTFGMGATASYSNASIALGIYAASNYYMATSMGVYSESYEAACAFGPYARAKAIQATALGYSTNANYIGSTAVGQNAATTAANQVQLGASGSTVYYYAIASRSDERDKTEIEDCAHGLEFIKKLKPRQFLWDYREDYYEKVDKGDGEIEVIKHERDGSKKRTRKHYGLIAQEVKQTIDETGEDFAGYQDHKVSGGEDILSLNYMELIAPTIKAIQEQQIMIEAMQTEIKELKNTVKNLKNEGGA